MKMIASELKKLKKKDSHNYLHSLPGTIEKNGYRTYKQIYSSWL